VIDIDVNDRANVQTASDYVPEIIEHMRRMEVRTASRRRRPLATLAAVLVSSPLVGSTA
jgi:hypothetical protein